MHHSDASLRELIKELAILCRPSSKYLHSFDGYLTRDLPFFFIRPTGFDLKYQPISILIRPPLFWPTALGSTIAWNLPMKVCQVWPKERLKYLVSVANVGAWCTQLLPHHKLTNTFFRFRMYIIIKRDMCTRLFLLCQIRGFLCNYKSFNISHV